MDKGFGTLSARLWNDWLGIKKNISDANGLSHCRHAEYSFCRYGGKEIILVACRCFIWLYRLSRLCGIDTGLIVIKQENSVLGAALAAVVTFNICIANHVYDAGVAVPAAYFSIIGIFVAWYELPKIWNLVVHERDIAPYRYYPVFKEKWQRYSRTGLKIVFNFLFVFVAAALWAYGFFNGNNYNIPSTPGLAGTKGYYNVTEFRLNNKLIAYSPFDSIRWQDATFEAWSSLSYKTNRAAIADRMIGYSPLRVKNDKTNRQLKPGRITKF